MDKRKLNGGNSTKSKKKYDRRKRISVSDTDSFNAFFERMKDDMMVFYESAYKGFLDKYVRHGEYYVYSHEYKGEVVYIGKGQKERAFSWQSRVSGHKELLRDNKLDVVILANNLTEENALLIEDSLIKNLKPKYNGR